MRASFILLSCLVGFTLQRAPKCDVGTRPACKDMKERRKGQPPCPGGHPKTCADGREQPFPGIEIFFHFVTRWNSDIYIDLISAARSKPPYSADPSSDSNWSISPFWGPVCWFILREEGASFDIASISFFFSGVYSGFTVCVSTSSPLLYLVLCLFISLALLPL